MDLLHFELITPERLVISEEIYEAILPTQNGQIAVLPNHIPLISLVKTGVISLRKAAGQPDSQLEHLAVSSGFIEITERRVRIMADSAERADEIDALKAEEARQRALELKEKAEDDISLADATALLEKSLAQIKITELKRHRSRKN